MPFTMEQVCVEGHPIQGDGCSPRNLQSLVSAIMRAERFEFLIDFLLQALKRRRQHRKHPRPLRQTQ